MNEHVAAVVKLVEQAMDLAGENTNLNRAIVGIALGFVDTLATGEDEEKIGTILGAVSQAIESKNSTEHAVKRKMLAAGLLFMDLTPDEREAVRQGIRDLFKP